MPSRDDAWALVTEYTESESLRRHMLAVEAAMRATARRFGDDAETWGVVGLLHDFDYERFPDDHPRSGEAILAERGWPEEIRRAILSHVPDGDVPRRSRMEKALHACDDITGLIVATTLVRPEPDIRKVKPRSVRKKWRSRNFAAGVDRDEIQAAVDDLGITLDEHIQTVLEAMQSEAEALGLAGD